MPRLPFTNTVHCVPQRYQHIMPVLSQGDVSRSEYGTTTDRGLGALGQLVGGKSMVDARPAPLQMPHDLNTSISVALDFPAKERGIEGTGGY